jgi:hypothetical protein
MEGTKVTKTAHVARCRRARSAFVFRSLSLLTPSYTRAAVAVGVTVVSSRPHVLQCMAGLTEHIVLTQPRARRTTSTHQITCATASAAGSARRRLGAAALSKQRAPHLANLPGPGVGSPRIQLRRGILSQLARSRVLLRSYFEWQCNGPRQRCATMPPYRSLIAHRYFFAGALSI